MKAQQGIPSGLPAARYYRANDPQWHWLEERDDPQVSAFLEAANQQQAAWFAPLAPLEEALYQSHLARRELAVTSLKTTLDHFTFWNETSAEDDYPCWWRHPNRQPEQQECFFDVRARAAEHDFYDMGDMALSPDEQWLAWTEDTQGDERFTLWLKALPNGTPEQLLSDIGAGLCWAEDQTTTTATLLFTRFDDTQRPDSVWRLSLSLMEPDASNEPVLVLREEDPEFWLGIGKTRSRSWLLLESGSKDTSEIHLLAAHSPDSALQCIQQRQAGVEYSIDHRPGSFYRLHNQAGAHFQLDFLPESQLGQPQLNWQTLIAHREEATLEGVDAFSWGLMLAERDHAQAQVRLRRLLFDAQHNCSLDETLALPEQPCSQMLEDAPHFDTRVVRLREESFTQPPSWFSLDLTSGERTLLKRVPVYGNLQPEQLVSRRLWATSSDGEQVPVSVVLRADLADQPLPTLLYGYGAYGDALDPWFSIARLELLERGAAFAVAHVRGGGERGEPWYLNGKMAHKENSFDDFLAARDALVEQGVSDSLRIAAYGASAGGLLVGTCINRAPEKFCAALLDVPFLDVLRTMQNPELPLTTAEYSEWGNPEEPEVAERIAAYSPIDNIKAQIYPALWIEGSWFDTRVSYWEPAKFYAQVAQQQLGSAPILMRTDMSSGHGGASGRFKAWRDTARQDAFILWALGLHSQASSTSE
ncbi:S9 family peptidase [Halomonas sp. QX-2]|jgi:oligopeptidase B|uniref:S9 family peptidase n=1 Tax=Vreelandella sedimenti TaxID=2729618 RepID=A0A7Z0N9W8_9GAMM|nr:MULTISPECIES: prolyl oligopeptidase family serine peptidase [Halomonas]NYT74290.1 S9 family peptidase [Halomonas sedimenti]|tara:strand:- start:51327 stop:53429 length:2103 start_codon:yes stop_codon:yes gene_type:complete